MPKRSTLLFCLAFLGLLPATAQTYYAWDSGIFYELTLPDFFCGSGTCELEAIGPLPYHDYSFCPNGNLYGFADNQDLYQIDPVTLDTTLIFHAAMPYESDGLMCVDDTLFYFLGLIDGLLYELNINSGIITELGETGFTPHEGLTQFQGEYYFPAVGGIVQLNIQDPANSVMVVPVPNDKIILGMTASHYCNILIGREIFDDSLYAINLIDGSLTAICAVSNTFGNLVTYGAYQTPMCVTSLDLDCDDSSGALDADYNALQFSCQSGPLGIADEDIGIMMDAMILSMTVELLPPMPDAPDEQLFMTGPAPNITISGEGTTLMTFTNSGSATIADFKQALRSARYNNYSLFPTGGPRTVQVFFTTSSGSVSNIALAYINVVELAQIPVDIGPDLQICEFDTVVLDAGNPGSFYLWSTGDDTQTTMAFQSGLYTVTVTDNLRCPGVDTMELQVLPLINVELTGDISTCQNSPASLTIITNSTIPLDIEVSLSTGGTYSFLNVTGNQNFVGNPSVTTTYEIISVIADVPICLSLTDSVQTVEVFPIYFAEMDVDLCGGDSVWLAYYWEHNAGVYNIQLQTQDGCDSIIQYTIESLPADVILLNAVTCDSTEAGVFHSSLPNPNGCDTIVQTTVTFVPSDTTIIGSTTCRIAEAGSDTLMLTNLNGCDSLVISGILYNPPTDTTMIVQTTCDSALLGNVLQLFSAVDGCDSLVMVSTILASTDTTFTFSMSCDSSLIGVTTLAFNGTDGCDSIVIATTEAIPPDTTLLFGTACDSSLLGTTIDVYSNTIGCDSIVITTITFSLNDSTFLNASTCDPAMAGTVYDLHINRLGCDSIVATTFTLIPEVEVFINSFSCDTQAIGNFTDTLVSHLGCDSIIHENVALLPSSVTQLFETTCASAEAGVFIDVLTNQYGCDSTVTLTITLIPPDTTRLFAQTCLAAEVDTIEMILSDQFGCDSLVINTISLFPASIIGLESVFDYHGYDVSCFDSDDGAVIANVTGVPPYQFEWSTGDIDQDLDNVAAGEYTITVTDGNGCAYRDSISLEAPPALAASFELSELDCFENNLGSVSITASGGVPDYQYAVEGGVFQSSSVISNLIDGTYACIVKDANDCEVNGIVRIEVPLLVSVALGEDVYINSGDTASLNAIVDVPLDSLAEVRWTSLSPIDCPACLDQRVSPALTTTYVIEVVSVDGCVALDSITVFVLQEKGIFIPTIFSPNRDDINDRLLIHGKPNIREIALMEIFDRWGNLVFTESNFQPADPSTAWDGTWNDKPQNPGVFAYRVIATYIDGSQQVYVGDVTLIR